MKASPEPIRALTQYNQMIYNGGEVIEYAKE